MAIDRTAGFHPVAMGLRPTNCNENAPRDAAGFATYSSFSDPFVFTVMRDVFNGGPHDLSEFEDPALQSDRDCVGSIVCAQFGEDALNVALHRFFRDRKLSADLLVRVPGGDQPENVDFP